MARPLTVPADPHPSAISRHPPTLHRVEPVLEGALVTDVARRNGVARQTVHDWLKKYATGGMAALVDRSSKPLSCVHQIPAVVEARIVELRRAHPGWGPRTILDRLAKQGVAPLPGRSSVHRALLRHGLIEPGKRRRRREDNKRWERSRAMDLWQMDVVGRIFLADGTELYAVTGVDDHSRFCVCARLVARATARPVCDALASAMRTHGVPDQILTDNGKVLTARFGKGPGPVLFDRICADNGIRHLLTAPYSPTTTGKVERFHRTLRAEWVRPTIGCSRRSWRRRWTRGSSTTTASGRISRWVWRHRSSGSGSPSPAAMSSRPRSCPWWLLPRRCARRG
jgi:transposase InsO family protein